MSLKQLDFTKRDHALFIRTPVTLVARIDDYARAKGLRTRKAAVLSLVISALDAAGFRETEVPNDPS